MRRLTLAVFIASTLLIPSSRIAAAELELDSHVTAALKWIAEHQQPDGNWSFDHRAGPCRGRCDGAGTATKATNAATAIALLPFLAAGQNHQQGLHQDVVKRGLDYLVVKAEPQGGGVSYLEPGGTMYAHGLATMALCEAYRQTKDEQLKTVCQSALDFISFAQDPVGGGWRYAPRQQGDTSVGGWQVAALRTGLLAGLDVPKKTLDGASRFLDAVQTKEGAAYGYATPGSGMGTTASGLISRIHLGWHRDNVAWRQGVEWLQKIGPKRSDFYYNYHATQVLAQRGSLPWVKWNARLENVLLAKRGTDGHELGSWHGTGGHTNDRGGRLYCTSLAALMLAMEQRKLGIFQVEDEESDAARQ